jgi:putative membrane protein
MKFFSWIKSLFVEREVRKFLIIFYSVGVIGLAVPFTFPLFKALTPLALVLSIFLLFLFHKFQQNLKTFLVFGAIYALSFAIEAVGVETGLIFGEYHYGGSIGPKLFDTPLIIGINWLFLAYTTISAVDVYRINDGLKFFIASMLMVVYDLVLEQVAPIMDMWYWANDRIPVQNYIAWFALSFIFISMIKIFKINTQNPIARVILLCQFVFFVGLFVIYRIIY